MSDTPRVDAAEKECCCTVNGAIVSGVVTADFARQLERELHWSLVEMTEAQNDVLALMADIRKADEMLMAWFKAASPWATPLSLEEGIKNLRNEAIEECAKLVELRAGQGPYAESMGAHRVLMSAADAVRSLKT